MKKRVIAINSSKRKMNTYGLLKQLKEQFEEREIEVDILHLFDYQIQECTGCEMCLRKGRCPINDDVEKLMDRMKDYDGVILSTPVYMGNLSGRLKVFIDRTCKWFHRPELVGIPSMLVVTTAASGIKDTCTYLENVSIQWGTFPTGKISRRANTMKKEVNEKEYKKFVEYLYLHREKYQPKMKQLIYYQVQKVLAEKILEIDREYWEQKDWINSIYYYNGKIQPLNKLVAMAFYKMLSSRVHKVGE